MIESISFCGINRFLLQIFNNKIQTVEKCQKFSMSGWDFDYDPDDSFITMDNNSFNTNSFDFSQDPFESITESVSLPEFPQVTQAPVQEISTPIPEMRLIQQQVSHTTDCERLVEENNKLREYFNSLKDRADKAANENQQLKAQLGRWREGFRSAMFSGMGIK